MSQATQISSAMLERALRDVDDYELIYQQSLTKLKQLTKEAEVLKCETQVLKKSVDEYKESVAYYQQKHIETCKKIEDTQIKQNTAKLADLHNIQQMAQMESLLNSNKIKLDALDMKVPQLSKLTIQKDNLIQEKIRLEEIVQANDIKLQKITAELM
ncbi:hypothetical protein PPYR_04555 [Photinus pyralis]|uniref:Uncharacterized protein n=1 Tax=Photinus pyralis TaxID=7054 RepID=A0A5N4AYF6_PHOPY|nr:uncharacterized protein LOC116162702 [Photinus pyralis]XP_031332272.1 uncharacterized protein LOC116162723 [Photinus pyralis]KAB0802307.1 hypothetical protein PPYR_04493 [Photinus pyralis]KAB0802369.1 hypothetical protein PPYR_04555 [Photinus pyralis]